MKQEPTQSNPNHWGKSGADIVERLRKCDADPGIANQEAYHGSLFAQAADEIERLREALEKAIAYLELIGPSPQLNEARAALSQKEGE